MTVVKFMSNGLACLVAALSLGAFGGTTTLVYSTVPAREGRPAVELKLFDSLVRDPNWTHGREVEVVIVEVAGNRGYNWHMLQP